MTNGLDRRSRSLWMDVEVAPKSGRLDGDKSCDTVVVGTGIAGISTAYELAAEGQKVILVDHGPACPRRKDFRLAKIVRKRFVDMGGSYRSVTRRDCDLMQVRNDIASGVQPFNCGSLILVDLQTAYFGGRRSQG
jgi:hypothetical protein